MPTNTCYCIFKNRKRVNGCAILNDDVVCNPETCTWKKTDEEYFASLEKAMRIYIKKTGMHDYIDKCVLGVGVQERFKSYLRQKARAENA